MLRIPPRLASDDHGMHPHGVMFLLVRMIDMEDGIGASRYAIRSEAGKDAATSGGQAPRCTCGIEWSDRSA